MRATKLTFEGYRRLQSTSCNVDSRLVAFLGPNEAGKSSVLTALEWFEGGDPLPSRDRYRPDKPADAVRVVEVTYTLSDDDRIAVKSAGLEVHQPPRTVIRAKAAGGQAFLWVQPPPRRVRAPFDLASEMLAECIGLAQGADFNDVAEVDSEQLISRLTAAIEAMADAETTWSDDSAPQLAVQAIDASLPTRADDESDPAFLPWAEPLAQCREALLAAIAANALAHPDAAVRKLLSARRPRFLQFTAADRDLRREYDLADEALRSDPPKALVNVLRVAGTTAEELWTAIQDDDRTAFKSFEGSLNTTLEERIRPAWHQSQLTLELDVDMTGLLQVLVRELDAGKMQPRVVISERSDGLRTFLALSCFLGARDLDEPPILLVDEAETHLHLDAQADLITLLTEDAQLSQVVYTTHSPGCLPQDLGTNLRFVSRDESNSQASLLLNSFWDRSSPSFSRLLFAMGAGAAAFSAFRRAVICEGPSEMILLPTLFRLARGGEAVAFQVAPGLSGVADFDQSLSGIAVSTAFLVDGDGGGETLANRLKASGYPSETIFALPTGSAIEDLLDREFYLDVVDRLMDESGTTARVERTALDLSIPIAKALELWSRSTRTRVPGHVLVAVRLAAEPETIILTDEGAAALRGLYDALTLCLDRAPHAAV